MMIVKGGPPLFTDEQGAVHVKDSQGVIEIALRDALVSVRDALRPSCRLKLPKIALKVPLLLLAAHSCHDDYYDGSDDHDVNADDDEVYGKVERPPRATEEDMHQCIRPPMISNTCQF